MKFFWGATSRSPSVSAYALSSAGYSRATRNDSYQVIGGNDIEFTDEVQSFGAIARGLLDVGLSPSWSLRGGRLAGFAHSSLDSSLCGSASLDSPFVGLSTGSAVRFGAARQFELGVLGDFTGFSLLRCATTQPAPSVHERDELGFDDPTLAASARLAHHPRIFNLEITEALKRASVDGSEPTVQLVVVPFSAQSTPSPTLAVDSVEVGAIDESVVPSPQ